LTATGSRPPEWGRLSRVLVVEDGDGLWGAQRYLLRLAPLLQARGYEQVLAAPEDSAIARTWRAEGRPQVHLALPPDRRVRRRGDRGPLSPLLLARELARTAANARRIAALTSELGIDCIHANAHWSHLEAALGGRLAGLPVVLHLHELTLPGIAGRLRAAAVRIADASVAVSNAVAECLPERPRSMVTVIHNGVDPTALSPGPAHPGIRRELAADPSAPVVLAMCRLDPNKGVDQIIRAVATLRGDLARTQLAIVGTSNLDQGLALRLRVLAAQLLGPRVRFLGPRQDITAVLRSVDVLVQASSREALGLAVLEAQACGTPVVAYPAAGTSEIVRDGETGLLARQDDVTQLSTCIGRVLTQPDLRDHLVRGARGQVATHFTLEKQADRQARLLGQLVAGGGVSRRRPGSVTHQGLTG
jgi:glycosyltransferase involved in cell wall biosynthesis